MYFKCHHATIIMHTHTHTRTHAHSPTHTHTHTLTHTHTYTHTPHTHTHTHTGWIGWSTVRHWTRAQALHWLEIPRVWRCYSDLHWLREHREDYSPWRFNLHRWRSNISQSYWQGCQLGVYRWVRVMFVGQNICDFRGWTLEHEYFTHEWSNLTCSAISNHEYRIAGNFRIIISYWRASYENFLAQYCTVNNKLCSTSLCWAVRIFKLRILFGTFL